MTRVIKVNPADPEREGIELAARVLRKGGIVAFPTETVYGLGANADNPEAVKRIYKIKKRPQNKPLTVHIADLEKLEQLQCEISPQAQQLIERFWPGPLTLILNSKNRGKVGVRMPQGAVPSALIKESGTLVVAPSANLSGEQPACDAARVEEDFNGIIDLIVDGGQCKTGIDYLGRMEKIYRNK